MHILFQCTFVDNRISVTNIRKELWSDNFWWLKSLINGWLKKRLRKPLRIHQEAGNMWYTWLLFETCINKGNKILKVNEALSTIYSDTNETVNIFENMYIGLHLHLICIIRIRPEKTTNHRLRKLTKHTHTNIKVTQSVIFMFSFWIDWCVICRLHFDELVFRETTTHNYTILY